MSLRGVENVALGQSTASIQRDNQSPSVPGFPGGIEYANLSTSRFQLAKWSTQCEPSCFSFSDELDPMFFYMIGPVYRLHDQQYGCR
jgi:hypothetical protein